MNDDRFKIFVRRLKEGECEVISETFEPDFMEITEEGLAFNEPVHVSGEAFVSNDNFVLTLCIHTFATLPCIVCNEPTQVKIGVKDLTHVEKMTELKSGLFQMRGLIREGLLLEVPLTAECCSGQCPERQNLAKYFSKEN